MTPEEAYYKCRKKNKRIPELEEIIATNSYCSYFYARNIIKGPWKRGEEAINKHPEYSFWYALYVIKQPFEKCHSHIFNSQYKDKYIKFLKSINYDMGKISEWLI